MDKEVKQLKKELKSIKAAVSGLKDRIEWLEMEEENVRIPLEEFDTSGSSWDRRDYDIIQ